MDTILVVNAGSSSLKFQVFALGGEADLKCLIKGQVDGIGSRPRLRASAPDGTVLVELSFPPEEVQYLPDAIQVARAWLEKTERFSFVAAGHRVVHGGPGYAGPVLINDGVLARLDSYTPLAPLQQQNNLAPIRALRALRPGLPQVACFDTAFHRAHDEVADRYALPDELYQQGIRRYGFHGLSYEYVAGRLRQIAPELAKGRVIVAHLGSGASMCALADGRSIESTMGFTALDGLPMGTRCGELDAGVVLYLIQQKGMSANELVDLLYRRSGMLGLSGISSDFRELLASDSPRARFAVTVFCNRVARHIASLAAALGGLDGIVFTAGVGENAAPVRSAICRSCEWLGLELDEVANQEDKARISVPNSRVGAYVIKTDENLMIARHARALVGS